MNLATALFAPQREKRSTYTAPSDWFWNWATGGMGKTVAGETVNTRTALGIAGHFAAIRNRGEDCAKLSLKLMKRGKNGGKEEARDHPIWNMVRNEPNPETNACNLFEFWFGSAGGWHGGFLQVVRDNGGRAAELYALDPTHVMVERNKASGALQVRYNLTDGQVAVIPMADVLYLHGLGLDGISQWCVTELARESMGGMLAVQKHASAFFGNGAVNSGFLKLPGAMKQDALERLRASFTEKFTGAGNHYKPIILEDGLEFISNTVDPERSQLQAVRQGNLQEIAIWHRMPPHKLQDLSQNKYATMYESNLDYLTDSLLPWLTRAKQEMERKLLSKIERQAGYHFVYDFHSLLQASPEKQAAAHQIYVSMGALNTDEVRDHLSMNPKADGTGQVYFINSAAQPMDAIIKKAALEIENLKNPPAPPPIIAPVVEEDEEEAPLKASNSRAIADIKKAHIPLLSECISRVIEWDSRKLSKIRENGTEDKLSNEFWAKMREQYMQRVSQSAETVYECIAAVTGSRQVGLDRVLSNAADQHVEWARLGIVGAQRARDEAELILNALTEGV